MAGGYTPSANPNKRLYNGSSEWQDDIDGLADYYSTFFREYDAVIGRFNGVDPMGERFESWTTYQYSYNNPINFNDPTGEKASSDRGKFFEDLLTRIAEGTLPAGMGNFRLTYLGDDENGNGGNGNVENVPTEPISAAVDLLHAQWGVTRNSLGGQVGFNHVVYAVISKGGAAMSFKSYPFYELTAQETVREQVAHENYLDALNTIERAYPNTITLRKEMYFLEFVNGNSHNTNPHFVQNSNGRIVHIKLSKDFFINFMNASPTNQIHTFGVLSEKIIMNLFMGKMY